MSLPVYQYKISTTFSQCFLNPPPYDTTLCLQLPLRLHQCLLLLYTSKYSAVKSLSLILKREFYISRRHCQAVCVGLPVDYISRRLCQAVCIGLPVDCISRRLCQAVCVDCISRRLCQAVCVGLPVDYISRCLCQAVFIGLPVDCISRRLCQAVCVDCISRRLCQAVCVDCISRRLCQAVCVDCISRRLCQAVCVDCISRRLCQAVCVDCISRRLCQAVCVDCISRHLIWQCVFDPPFNCVYRCRRGPLADSLVPPAQSPPRCPPGPKSCKNRQIIALVTLKHCCCKCITFLINTDILKDVLGDALWKFNRNIRDIILN